MFTFKRTVLLAFSRKCYSIFDNSAT